MAEHIVYNRELFFAKLLRIQSRDSVFWLTEPDHRLVKPFPELADDIDLCLLRRNDEVAITPCWKLARSSAAPFFEEALQYIDGTKQKNGMEIAKHIFIFGRIWVAQVSTIRRLNRGG